MPAATQNPRLPRLTAHEALLRKRRGWFFGLTGDQFVKYVFQGNAAVSIVVLALITFTIFRDAVGFFPANHENLMVYRLAGLEYVDIFRDQVRAHSALSRYLASVRAQQFATLMKKPGLSAAAAQAQLAGFDDFANRFADTLNEEETLLGNLTDLVTGVKERQKVAQDLAESKRHLLAARKGATPERAILLQKQADATQIEVLDFKAEIKPVLALGAEVPAANVRQLAAMKQLVLDAPKFTDPLPAAKMDNFRELVGTYATELAGAEAKLTAWDQAKPVSWFESFNAFAFGRHWITGSFW